MASMRTEIWRVPAGTAAEAVRAMSAVVEVAIGRGDGGQARPRRPARRAAFRNVAVTAAWSVCAE